MKKPKRQLPSILSQDEEQPRAHRRTGRKVAIAEACTAYRAWRGPRGCRTRTIFSLRYGRAGRGREIRGEFEERYKGRFERGQEVRRQDHPLLADELHTIAGVGKTEGSMDAGNLLKPSGSRRAALYRRDHARRVPPVYRKDAALERRFQPVMVNEPTVEDTIASCAA